MTWIAGTGLPASILQVCPRCRIFRKFMNVDGGTTFRCGGCEWYWTLATAAVPAAPAVPASTVNATNTGAGVIAVTISGGTLTAVTVNAVQVGTTAGTYLVPAAGTINITYTVAPTWTWQLPVTNGALAQGATAVPVASGGAYFTAAMALMIDTGINAEVVTVQAGATGTSIPVINGDWPAGFGLVKAHTSGVSFSNLAMVSTFSAVGQDAVPAAPGWGF